MGRSTEDLTGQTFGRLAIEGRAPSVKAGNATWWCRCGCNRLVKFTSTILRNKPDIECGYCSRRKGFKRISGKFWYDYRKGAQKRQIPWEITIEYLWELWLKQEKKCALSGLDLTLPQSSIDFSTRNYSASIDRIDSSIGYVEGNIQWVHKIINLMKQSFSQSVFIQMCKAVANNNDNH